MCFSSKGTTESNTISKFEPPDYTKGLWENYVNTGTGIGQNWMDNPPLYTGTLLNGMGGLDPQAQMDTAYGRIAPMNEQQMAAIGGINSLASSPVWNQAYQQAYNTLGGDYTQHAEYNQFGGASNPYIEDLIKQSNADTTRDYGTGTAADLNSAAQMQNAFGGSTHQLRQAQNERSLADSLARNTTNIRQGQYNLAAQLEQQRLATENQNYENERQRQMATLGLIPGLYSGQGGIFQQQMGMGSAQQQQYQSVLDSLRSMFNEQLQGPLVGLDIMGNALTRASGGAGTTSTQTLGPGYSPMQGLLGGGLGAAGLYQLFK